MTKLRNIGYLRFGSKIRQGFTVTTPYLTPPLSLSLWMSWEANGERVERNLLYSAGEPAAPLPDGMSIKL